MVWFVRWVIGGGWKGENGAYLISPVPDTGTVEDEFVVGGVVEALFAVPVGGVFGLVVWFWFCIDRQGARGLEVGYENDDGS